MNPNDIYKSRSTTGWSRIDMLIELYNETIRRLTLANTAIAANDQGAADPHLIRSQRLVIEIMDGLNLDYGELPERVQQLCIFVSGCINSRDPERLQAAIRILNQLRDGYQGIRTQATELESEGAIPSILDLPDYQAIA